MTQDKAFKTWWYNEGSQAPYKHHDFEEHIMRMCEIAWSNGAKKEREACAKVCEDDDSNAGEWHWEAHVGGYFARAIRARGEQA